MATPAPVPSARRLAATTGAALAVAALVLVVAVLPAEYGLDPTGIGRAAGFARLGDPVEPGGSVAATPRDELNRTLYRWSAEWTLVETSVGRWNGTIGELRTTRVPFVLNLTNVTSVTARLAWTDADGSAPDVLEVSIDGPGVESPSAEAASGPDGRGNATAVAPVASVPFPRAADGRVTVDAREADRAAAGEWVATVRAYDLGDGPGEAIDVSADWTLVVVAERHALAQATDASGRGDFDRVLITLQPGEDVEYKLHLSAGARMEYRWSATLPVYADFHGDTEEKPDDFVQYRVESARAASGELVAAFEGRHGWYFVNDEAQPVTVTLETRGEYRILGKV